jgi:hypothetical protein
VPFSLTIESLKFDHFLMMSQVDESSVTFDSHQLMISLHKIGGALHGAMHLGYDAIFSLMQMWPFLGSGTISSVEGMQTAMHSQKNVEGKYFTVRKHEAQTTLFSLLLLTKVTRSKCNSFDYH